MISPNRLLASTTPQVANTPDWAVATVVACHSASEASVSFKNHGGRELAQVAAHISLLVPGQQVLVVRVGAPESNLIIAAYRFPSEKTEATNITEPQPLIQFDDASKTLSIHAGKLQLQGIECIELRCGESIIRLDAQGEVFTQGESITQAAIGPFRIEGASIDLN